ncbi:MAG: DUF2802 domain-containing protein [Gammaproteobacteria bacterium]|nr:DUF2802 domain-containing protein [Gammaproteobacteria bacterium]
MLENPVISWVLIAVVGLLIPGCLLLLVLTIRSYNKKVAELKAGIGVLGADFNALCAGAVGVDRRLALLEKQGRDLGYRQETIENRQTTAGDLPYGEAIQLVQKGASAVRLVDDLGLSHSEAELVVMLHGLKEAV